MNLAHIFQNVDAHPLDHGEVIFLKMNDDFEPEGFSEFNETDDSGDFIVGHSESGHHHLMESEGVTVMEREFEGMKILYAIVNNPNGVVIKQDATNPHKEHRIPSGKYIIPNAIDFDPILQQARRVAD